MVPGHPYPRLSLNWFPLLLVVTLFSGSPPLAESLTHHTLGLLPAVSSTWKTLPVLDQPLLTLPETVHLPPFPQSHPNPAEVSLVTMQFEFLSPGTGNTC